MDDLLKEAIADAKAVRETALENAKMALEEAFTPRLQSMLSKKIQTELEDDEDDAMDEPADDEEEEMEGHYSEDGDEEDMGDETEMYMEPEDEEPEEDRVALERLYPQARYTADQFEEEVRPFPVNPSSCPWSGASPCPGSSPSPW